MNRRIGGKKAQAYGAHFERLIELSCRNYKARGLAYIEKTPEPFKPIKRKGARMIGFYEKKAQPDFAGTLKNGRSIVFEAKHTNTTNLAFNRLEQHQKGALEIHDRLGAMSFILISFSLDNFYKVSYKDWVKLESGIGKKSVNEKDLAAYRLDSGKGLVKFL